MKRSLAIAVALVLGFAPASAQVVQNQLSGNEVWSAAQSPGGPSNWLSVQDVRNTSALSTVTGTGAATTAMTRFQSSLVWTGAAPTTWAVTLPTTPIDGHRVQIGTVTTLTTMVTVTAPAGATLAAAYAAQTLTAGTSIEFQYSAGTTTWYRMQ